MRIVASLILIVITLALPGICRADDPCLDSASEMATLIVRGARFGETVLGTGEVRTITRLHPATGEAVLAQWNYGAAGRIECAYVAYRRAGTRFKYAPIDSKWGSVRASDVDADGIDELLIFLGQDWGFDCSANMGSLPHQLRIVHIDTATGKLVDVTRSYGPLLRTFLFDLKGRYDAAALESRLTSASDCEGQWTKLLTATYESAWFTLLVASGAIAVLTFGMGLSHSTTWRWLAKAIGAVTFFATTAVAIYSLGQASWHVMAFSDLWSAIQVVSGYRFNPILVELLSTALSAYAGWTLLTS
jgi:hypothetical protein